MPNSTRACPVVFPHSARASRDPMSDIELLHSISVALIGEQDREALYGKIVDAAVAITGSHFGTMQLLCVKGDEPGHDGQLQLLYSHGLSPEAIELWQWVDPGARSSCTQALILRERVIIPDFEQWPGIAGTQDLAAFRLAGIRSAQTTPLMSRNGQLLGMISTHWREPHHPSERDLRLLDILARQAADLLERTAAEQALRQFNENLERRVMERTAELLQAEEKLRQSQKMEAVGQLTGGLAHDFNNLLAGISGALGMMERRIEQGRPDDLGKYLVAAQGATQRAASLTHRLLAFSRRQALDPRPTDVNALMHGMVELVQRTVGGRILVKTEAADALWLVRVDAGQLENALLNLCINARDAMPEGGHMTLRTRNRWVNAHVDDNAGLATGEYLCLSVTDTGTGIAPEILARVFEPFFTTKPVGQGTGLGLSMIYGFAQQSGGGVRIASVLGQGTEVSIYLPRCQASVAADACAGQVGEASNDAVTEPRQLMNL